MICRQHGMMNDDGTCPYCSIFELEQQLAEQSALYDKAFSDSGGLLHRKELVRMVNERDAQLTELREAVPTLKRALLDVSICSQNSMSSKHECGKIARAALGATSALLKQGGE